MITHVDPLGVIVCPGVWVGTMNEDKVKMLGVILGVSVGDDISVDVILMVVERYVILITGICIPPPRITCRSPIR